MSVIDWIWVATEVRVFSNSTAFYNAYALFTWDTGTDL